MAVKKKAKKRPAKKKVATKKKKPAKKKKVAKKKPAKKKAAKKKKPAKKKKAAGKKKAFGGYSISFKGCTDSLEQVFGKKGLGPSQMTKLLWVYIKKKKLAGK